MDKNTVGSVKYDASIDLASLSRSLKQADKMVEGSAENQEKSATTVSKKTALAMGAIAGVAATAATKAIDAITNSLGSAISRVDTLNNAPRVLQNLGFSADESAKSIKRLDLGTRGLPTSLDGITSSLLAIASASGKSIDEATDLTLAFNNMALAGGKGGAEAQRALVQFTQALGRGKFQMQDFNTLAEVMPAQLNQVAKSLLGADANTRTLGTALSDGTLTIDQFNKEVVRLNREGGKGFASFEKQAKDATKGIGTSFANLQTAVTRGVSSIITSIGTERISQAAAGIGKAFETALKAVGTAIKIVQGDFTGVNGDVRVFALTISEFLRPKLEAIWNTLNKDVIPTLMRLWNEVLEPLVPVIGVALVGAIGLAIDALNLFLSTVTPVINFLLDNKAAVLAFAGVFGTLAIAMKFSAIAAAFQASMTSVLASIGAVKGATLGLLGIMNPFTWSLTVALLGFGVVMNQIDQLNKAVDGANNAIAKRDINKYLETYKNIKKRDPEAARRFMESQSRASGGPVTAGKPYLVGENPDGSLNRTSELFVPRQSGSIVSAKDLQGMLGGGTTVNVTINPSGIMASSKADLRQIATQMAQLINEQVVANTGKPAIQGI